MPNDNVKRKVIDVSENHHTRLSKLARQEGISLKRYTALIFESVLPIAEQGKVTIEEPKMIINKNPERHLN